MGKYIFNFVCLSLILAGCCMLFAKYTITQSLIVGCLASYITLLSDLKQLIGSKND